MTENQRDEMFNKIRRYDALSMQLRHIREMKSELEKGKALEYLKIFGANKNNDYVYVPKGDNFNNRLKEVIKTEVNNEILRIEEEIRKL